MDMRENFSTQRIVLPRAVVVSPAVPQHCQGATTNPHLQVTPLHGFKSLLAPPQTIPREAARRIQAGEALGELENRNFLA